MVIQVMLNKCLEHLIMYTHRTGGQHPNPLTNFPDNKGWTPLHYACYDNNIKLVLQLIKAGADPNARYDLSCGQAVDTF